MEQKTKILATIGPASSTLSELKKMVTSGMNAVRINTAHGTIPEFKERIRLVRQLKSIPIVLDIKGPELRVRLQNKIQLRTGKTISLGLTPAFPNHFSYDFSKEVKPGTHLLFDNGKMTATILAYKDKEAILKITQGGTLLPNKSVTIPNTHLNIPSLSKKDIEAMHLGKREKVEYFALSFVRNKSDILNFRRVFEKMPGPKYPYGLIAKIENREGVDKVNEILEHVEALMVARGDLSVEIPYEDVPDTQKQLLNMCQERGILDICATEMLESMITNIKPTNAEIADVHNAVLDGADCLMLSGETAIGKNPAHVVSTMAKIAAKATCNPRQLKDFICRNASDTITASIGNYTSLADKIICITRSGYTARRIAGTRPLIPIIAITSDQTVWKKLQLDWGINPILANLPRTGKIKAAIKILIREKLIQKKDRCIIIASNYTLGKSIDTVSIAIPEDLL
ncbi:MAG: pyruvate kinase [Nanoarchaeota archaeon]